MIVVDNNKLGACYIHIKACESGSIFEGVMPNDLYIYVTIASNAQECSFGTYCPVMDASPPPQYINCLGDLYGVALIENRVWLWQGKDGYDFIISDVNMPDMEGFKLLEHIGLEWIFQSTMSSLSYCTDFYRLTQHLLSFILFFPHSPKPCF